MTRPRAILAIVLTASILGALSACTPPESSQRRGTGDGTGTGRGAGDGAGLHLLTNPLVEKDLHLSDSQRVQIRALNVEARENRGMIGQKVAEILTPPQLSRLKQIRLQVEGPAGLNTPETIKALDLSPGQCVQLSALEDQVRQRVQEIMAQTKGLSAEQRRAKFPEILVKLDQLRRETIERAIAVLTPQQHEKFEKMQGVKINMDAPPPGAAPAAKAPPVNGGGSP